MKKRKTETIDVYPYTVSGTICSDGDLDAEISFSVNVDIDEDEFEKALRDKEDGKYQGWCMETPGDLAVFKVYEFFDRHGFDREDYVDVTKCEGDKTRKKVRQ